MAMTKHTVKPGQIDIIEVQTLLQFKRDNLQNYRPT